MGCGDRLMQGCLKLFRPDPRNRRHQCYCSSPACKRPARPPAKPAGSPSLRTKATSTAPCMSPGSGLGGRAIPGIGARVEVSAVRYKMSQRRNLLVLLSKRPIWCARRYKRS